MTTTPRLIKVKRRDGRWTWDCTLCPSFMHVGFGAFAFTFGYRPTLAQAADAGRAHLRQHHKQTDYLLAN